MVALWTVQNGFVDEVPVEKVKDFQAKLTDYLTSRKADLLGRIAREKALSDSITGELKKAVTDFKQTYH